MHLASRDGVDGAGALVLWRQRGPYRTVVLPPFSPYSALITNGSINESRIHAGRSALDVLIASLEKRFHALSFLLHPDFKDARVWTWRGWRVLPFYTYQICLQKDEDLIRTWSDSTRLTFRKASSTFRFEEKKDAAPWIAELNQTSYQRHRRRAPLHKDLLISLINTVQEAGLGRTFVVAKEKDGPPEGGVCLLHDDSSALYWVAGSLPGPAMTVLLGELLPLLQREGLSTFDFVGANTPSIAEFKRRFGPRLTPYFLAKKHTRPELAYFHRIKG